MTTLRKSFLNSALLSAVCAAPAFGQNPDAPSQRGPIAPSPMQVAPAHDQAELHGGNRQLGASLESLRTPIHTADEDTGLAYGTWAAGDTYKASFHAGMTFVPYLGSDYPHNQPLSWQTTSAMVGDVELIQGNATPVQQDYRYEYRFGGITEAYDVLAEGLEQTFIINQLPAAGDLVITGSVTTALQALNVSPAHQAVIVHDAQGRAITRYGEAVAFDANGDRIALATGFKNGAISLHVPAAWLANAALPVVVDPLLSRVQIAIWGAGTGNDGEVGEVDICRDDEATTNNVMITYTRDASALDGDVWARLCNDDLSGGALVFSDITTSWDTDETSCAFVGGADRFVIALRRYFRTLTPTQSRIRAHVHDSGSLVLNTLYASLFTSSSRNEWRPDVGGVESFYAGDDAMIVFQSENNAGGNFAATSTSEIWGVVFDPTTTNGTFGAEFAIYASGVLDNERPSVNQVAVGGTSLSWIVMLQSYNNSIAGDDWDIIGKQVDNAAGVSTGQFISDFAQLGTDHQLGPVVEGSDGRYAVAFATVDVAYTPYKTSLISGKALQVERFDWAHGVSAPSGNKAPMQIRANTDRRWEATGLGYDSNDDSHYAVGFRAVSPGVPAAYFARVGFNGEVTEGGLGGGSVLYYVASQRPTMVSCVFDNDSGDFLFAYGVDDNTSTQPVYGHALEYAAVTPDSVSGTGCSTATIAWIGNQQIGAEFNYLWINNPGTPVGHFPIVSLGTTDLLIVDPAVFPGCRLLVQATGPNYLATLPFQFGETVDYTIALPEFLDPMTLYFQDWMFDGTLFYGTQRLTVPIVK